MYCIWRELREGWRIVGRDDDVCGGHEVIERVLAVDDDRALVPVHIGMRDAALDPGTVFEKRRLLAERVAIRGLSQYHVRAEITEQARGERAGKPVGQVHHSKSIECARHFSERSGREVGQGGQARMQWALAIMPHPVRDFRWYPWETFSVEPLERG